MENNAPTVNPIKQAIRRLRQTTQYGIPDQMYREAVDCLEKEYAELTAEVEYLKERLHKCDGMANEINILTAENRQLTAERDRLKAALEPIANHLSDIYDYRRRTG